MQGSYTADMAVRPARVNGSQLRSLPLRRRRGRGCQSALEEGADEGTGVRRDSTTQSPMGPALSSQVVVKAPAGILHSSRSTNGRCGGFWVSRWLLFPPLFSPFPARSLEQDLTRYDHYVIQGPGGQHLQPIVGQPFLRGPVLVLLGEDPAVLKTGPPPRNAGWCRPGHLVQEKKKATVTWLTGVCKVVDVVMRNNLVKRKGASNVGSSWINIYFTCSVLLPCSFPPAFIPFAARRRLFLFLPMRMAGT